MAIVMLCFVNAVVFLCFIHNYSATTGSQAIESALKTDLASELTAYHRLYSNTNR